MPIVPPQAPDSLFVDAGHRRRPQAAGARRQAPPSITGDRPPRGVTFENTDTFGLLPARRHAAPQGLRSRELHPSRLGAWPVHSSLRGRATQSIFEDPEVVIGEDGELDVVDCEIIGSRKELKRWRLSLTDFHALVAGGTEAIGAYREEKLRQQEIVASAELAADLEVEDDAFIEAATAQPVAAASADTLLPQTAPLPAGRFTKLYDVMMWPWRTCMRLIFALLRKIG